MPEPSAESLIAIIPARGGSKRIPRKNIRPFLGTPLLARTIATLRDSDLDFEDIIVSTDDTEIADVALAAGASVPFMRPRNLADDHTPTSAVIQHAILELEHHRGTQLAVACVIYPAAVFTLSSDLRAAYEMLMAGDADYVFSATTFAYPIQRALRRLPDDTCEMFQPEYLTTRSQDLETAYHDAGQFYMGRRDAWVNLEPVFTSKAQMFLIPRYRVQDIDDEEDWLRAEMLYRVVQSRGWEARGQST